MRNPIRIKTDLILFLSSIAALIIIGLIFIYSASSVYAIEKGLSATYYVQKQAIGLLLGFIGLIILRSIPLSIVQRFTPLFFILSLCLTALTRIPSIGVQINGAYRWLRLPGLLFQPSELLKIAFILYIAHLLSKKESRLSSFIYGYLPFLIIIGLSCLILLAQPDFGMAATLAATAFIMLFVAEMKPIYLLGTFMLALPMVGALIYYRSYRLRRILIFLNPWKDPQGSGFQIIQSLIAIGSGNWLGTGISHSQQKLFYLPMQHTDFIFSIIAEEAGFLGALIVITLYMLILYSGIKLAMKMPSTFCSYTTLGFVLMISIQATMNIFVALGLAPTKGVGLPFISFGSSALVCSVAFLGVIINCVHSSLYRSS